MPHHLIAMTAVFPDNCPPDDINAVAFQINVTWRGNNLYSVDRRGLWQLSSGGKWTNNPLPMNRRHYRFTYNDALRRALTIVDDLTVNGRTWKQWQETD